MTGALASYKTQFKRGNAATPEVFTLIAEAGDYDGPNLKTTMDDATTHSSNGWEEKKPTIKSVGQIKFPIAFISTDTTHSAGQGLVYDWANGTLHNYQMVFPDGVTWTFSCYVSELNFKGTVKGHETADVVLDVTGAPTLA